MLSMPKTALMCPPTFFDVREAKNPYMGRPIDRKKAQQQWGNLRRALEDSGVKVELIDPVEGLDDMVFTANQVFVGWHDRIGKFVVPSSMHHSSRHEEVVFFTRWFRDRGYRILEVDLTDECLEGHGDLIWHLDHSRVWAGYGFRSTQGGVELFAAAMKDLGVPVVSLELVDDHCYHLDTCFCPLNGDAVLMYPAAFSGESLKKLSNHWTRIHELSRDEVQQFLGNGVVVNGHFITPRVTPHLNEILAREQLTPVVVETSEFEKSGGSVFCMKTFIE